MTRRMGLMLLAALLLVSSAAASAAARKAQAEPDCGRACLRAVMDRYIAGLVAHDTKGVPLAADVRVVENVTRIRPGEGFWKTAAAPATAFRIYVPDPVSQQIGFMGVMQEDGKPVQVGIRLKLRDGQIVEAEGPARYEPAEPASAARGFRDRGAGWAAGAAR